MTSRKDNHLIDSIIKRNDIIKDIKFYWRKIKSKFETMMLCIEIFHFFLTLSVVDMHWNNFYDHAFADIRERYEKITIEKIYQNNHRDTISATEFSHRIEVSHYSLRDVFHWRVEEEVQCQKSLISIWMTKSWQRSHTWFFVNRRCFIQWYEAKLYQLLRFEDRRLEFWR